jgi:hypothetical protein
VRVLAVLLLAPALAAAIALGSDRLVPPVAESSFEPNSVVWGERVFTERRDLARWLRNRGRTYRVWAVRHPAGVKKLRRIAAIERRDAQEHAP